MNKSSISTYSLQQLEALIKERKLPNFRAKQIFIWLHQKSVTSFSEMTNLPKTLCASLDEQFYIEQLFVKQKQQSKDGTAKYLLQLSDGNCIETVLMRYNYGNTVCVSTQVGCRMGCKFCASTQGGLVRHLDAGEIAAEVYAVQKDTNERVSHIVLMGIGEPLDNYDNVLTFLQIISSQDGINISMRNISLSTCGIVPMIDKLANEHLGLTLSVSLHAPTDEIRSSMMPINNAYNVNEVIMACKNYFRLTGRRISFEYSMVKGVNDTEECARKLAHITRGFCSHINLIPINPVDGSPYSATDDSNINLFKEKLEALGLTATIRRRLGTDISAACGQLRNELTQTQG